MQSQIHYGDGVAFGEMGDVVVMSWSAPVRIERAHWMTDRLQRRLSARDDSLVIVQLISVSATPPDAATRAQGAYMLTLVGPRTRCLVTLALGNDLWAILVRMINRTIARWSAVSKTSHFVKSIDEVLLEIDRVRTVDTPPGAEIFELLTRLAVESEGSRDHPVNAEAG